MMMKYIMAIMLDLLKYLGNKRIHNSDCMSLELSP